MEAVVWEVYSHWHWWWWCALWSLLCDALWDHCKSTFAMVHYAVIILSVKRVNFGCIGEVTVPSLKWYPRASIVTRSWVYGQVFSRLPHSISWLMFVQIFCQISQFDKLLKTPDNLEAGNCEAFICHSCSTVPCNDSHTYLRWVVLFI